MSGQKIRFRIILLIALLGAATGMNYVSGQRDSATCQLRTRQSDLQQAFKDLPGWQGLTSTPLSANIAQQLSLDDYLFRSFGQPNLPVSLYIGFYRTAGKVGASHDPLVCFQGQGWQVVNKKNGRHKIPGYQNLQIDYATMVVQRENDQELIIYWFQTDSKTANNTLEQKIDMVWQRLKGGRENSAFVRISSPLSQSSKGAVQKQLMEFIDVFYPRFYTYITTG